MMEEYVSIGKESLARIQNERDEFMAKRDKEMDRAAQAEAQARQYRQALLDLLREAQAYESRSKHLLAECQNARRVLSE